MTKETESITSVYELVTEQSQSATGISEKRFIGHCIKYRNILKKHVTG